jgi:hypothetical protein
VPPPSQPPAKVAAVPAPAPAAEAVAPRKADSPGKPVAAAAPPAPARTAAAPAKPKPATPATRKAPVVAADEDSPTEPDVVASAPPPATLSLAISPWGEVHVDGKLRGISPPLRDIELAPGRHRIEIRNAGFPPHVETVEARAGGKIRVRHKFQN